MERKLGKQLYQQITAVGILRPFDCLGTKHTALEHEAFVVFPRFDIQLRLDRASIVWLEAAQCGTICCQDAKETSCGLHACRHVDSAEMCCLVSATFQISSLQRFKSSFLLELCVMFLVALTSFSHKGCNNFFRLNDLLTNLPVSKLTQFSGGLRIVGD